MFDFLMYDVTLKVVVALLLVAFFIALGLWLRGAGGVTYATNVYATSGRVPRKTPQLWKIAQQVRDGKDLPALADELDDICNRFRYFMTHGETMLSDPSAKDRLMFRQILDEGWEVYEKFDKESSHA